MLLLNALVGVLVLGVVTVGPAVSPSAAPRSTSSGFVSDSINVPDDDAQDLVPQATPRPWQSIVLHHSATAGASVESIDAAHRRQKDRDGKPWLGIGYHFVVGNGRQMSDGQIEPTFRWREQLPGAHAGQYDYNEHGIGICLVGNFDVAPPTERQMDSLARLVEILARRYGIPRQRIVRHQDVRATQCPGHMFPFERALARVHSTNQESLMLR
jgi:hypothetical protein